MNKKLSDKHPKQTRFVYFVWGWGLETAPALYCVCSSRAMTALYEFQTRQRLRMDGHGKYWTRIEKILLNHSFASEYKFTRKPDALREAEDGK